MKNDNIQFIEEIINSTPDDELISFDSAFRIAIELLMLNENKALIKEIIQLIKQRFIEDLITIQLVTPFAADGLAKEKMIPAKYDDNLQFIKTITDELRKFPGGYATHAPQELQPLIYTILESNENAESLIFNLEPKAMLLETDMGLTIIGIMAMTQGEKEDVSRVWEKRSRLALIRRDRKNHLDGLT